MPVGKYPETLTYWAPGERNDYGVAEFAAPVLIRGRWEDTVEQVRTEAGDEITSRAQVFVDTLVVSDGYLAHGDQTTEADPNSEAAGGEEIRMVGVTRNIRYSDQEIVAYL